MKKIKSIILVILLCALLTGVLSSCLVRKAKFISDGELIDEVVVMFDGLHGDAPDAPEKPGYTFICWKSSTMLCRAGTNIPISASVTFHAVWEREELITEEPNGLFYRKIDGDYEIAAYLGWASSLTLPSDYNGEKLISIDKCAFLGSRLEEIILPETITRIGESAFKNCESLQTIIIPDAVTKIADETFRHCTELRQITLPKGLTEIGAYAFSYCKNVYSIDIPYGVHIKKRAFEDWKGSQTIYIHGKSYGSIFRFYGCKAKRVFVK
ncbi:MAG: leucine-rich repeat protein [Clostridiales bacterium]|jgi:hypothetical protein|nr:leucine-rich repeat protein [Clostridiales bacterium]